MTKVTFESVAKAAEEITAAGGKPSVRSVTAHLGGGSPNYISPFLAEWKSGRPTVRASDIEIDPRLAQVVSDMLHKASEQAAKAAEERAADVQADADAIAEAGREAEDMAEELAAQLAKANEDVAAKERALEIATSNAEHDAESATAKIQELDRKLADERERLESATGKLARAEVKLEQVPALEAEVKRLADIETQAAVLTANLSSANATIDDLKQRLSDAYAQAKAAQEEVTRQSREAEKARIAEQAAQARIESVAREMETLKGMVADAKADTKSARSDAIEYKAEIKQLRTEIAATAKGKAKPKPEAKPDQNK